MKARSLSPLSVTVGMSVVVVALASYDYWAVREWRRSSIALVNRATYNSAELLVRALTRDMRGAQMLVLANRDAGDLAAQDADASSQVATAFTRFPYPESFFVWRKGDSALVFFDRGNRTPAWAHEEFDRPGYAVVVVRGAPFGSELLQRLQEEAANRRAYTYLHRTVGQDAYQIVARLEYADAFRDELIKVTGFTVNLSWVREHYFPDIVAQVARINETSSPLNYSIVDEVGNPVVGTVSSDPATSFDLPLQFFDPWAVDINLPDTGRPDIWKVRVSAAGDPTVIWAARGADWTLLVITVTALALALSFFLTARAVQASASLTAMRADFVASVTHDLKTPLATIRAVADTMIRQQLEAGTIQRYATTLVEESRRLSRLVDNMLAYARVTDVTDIYSFEEVPLAELIEDALRGFRQQIFDGGFAVELNVPHDLPAIRGDRTALRLALDNLIDNAIRYSGDQRRISIAASHLDSRVVIEVSDRGVGIPASEIETVKRKFVRGTRTHNSGTGLGLTIVQRVVVDHGGQLRLRSEVGKGTTASFDVPICDGR